MNYARVHLIKDEERLFGADSGGGQMTAKKAAIRLIYKYVQRGDSIESLRQSGMGEVVPGPEGYDVAIGGYINGKYISPEWIVINELNGRPYHTKFKLADICTSIRRGATA